jgi:hypothetical protein
VQFRPAIPLQRRPLVAWFTDAACTGCAQAQLVTDDPDRLFDPGVRVAQVKRWCRPRPELMPRFADVWCREVSAGRLGVSISAARSVTGVWMALRYALAGF